MRKKPAKTPPVAGFPAARWLAVARAAALTSALLVAGMLSNPSLAFAAAPVGLGAAGTYSVLAGTMVTSTGATTISGDLGVSPGTAVVGFPPGTVNDATPTITGTTDAPTGTTVTVTLAGQTLTTTVQPGGTWALTAAPLTEGTHAVTASVTDAAGNTGTATQTLTVLGGVLSITVPTDAGNLGSASPTVGGGVISGALGQVQVTDMRHAGVGSGWIASVASTPFAPPTGPAIAASAVGYAAGPITKTGTATYTANDPGELNGVVPAVTATGITGDNSATWNPVINVTIPANALAGVYSATITHSVL